MVVLLRTASDSRKHKMLCTMRHPEKVSTGPRKYFRAFGKQKHLLVTEKRPWNDPGVRKKRSIER
jgi:hypothetical protein